MLWVAQFSSGEILKSASDVKNTLTNSILNTVTFIKCRICVQYSISFQKIHDNIKKDIFIKLG